MTGFDPDKHHRRSVRLTEFDYAGAGAYFVTVCTRNKECLLGEVMAGEMCLNACGEIVAGCWQDIPVHFPGVCLGAFVVMPNHVHGILIIETGKTTKRMTKRATHESPLQEPSLQESPLRKTNPQGKDPEEMVNPRGPENGSIGAVIGLFKAAAGKRINHLRGTPGVSLWQRNYYEHVIRDEGEFKQIGEYIQANPGRWGEDGENPRS